MDTPLKIVLTTDFTDPSHHAIDYAIKMFAQWQGEITYYLLHGFKQMAPYVDTGSIPVITNQAWETESMQQLEKEVKTLKQKANIKVSAVFEIGSISEVVKKIEERENPDLFIMASREKSFFERMTFGSNTIQVMANVTTPVLTIPLEAEFKKIDTVVFAADFEPLGTPFESFELFKALVEKFDAKLQVLRVYASEKQMEGTALQDSIIHKYMERVEHEHYPVVNADVYEGIISFIDQKTPDMVVMIPRDKNFIEKIFKSSVTRKMTYEANVPLLLLK